MTNQTIVLTLFYIGSVILGLIIGIIIGFLVGLAYVYVMKLPQSEGTASYAIVLVFVPLGALVGSLCTPIALAFWRSYS